MTEHYITQLQRGLEAETEAQKKRFLIGPGERFGTLQREGIILFPLTLRRSYYGFADYPEVQFILRYPAETRYFRDGDPIVCFSNGAEPVKGVLLELEGREGTIRLFADEHPDWMEGTSWGIQRAPDEKTFTVIRKTLDRIATDPKWNQLASRFIRPDETAPISTDPETLQELQHQYSLNESQAGAVSGMLGKHPVLIVHGPPGTGKTTTIAAGIEELAKRRYRIFATAPSNTAADHLAMKLVHHGLNLLRIGNFSKTHPDLLPFTPEGKLAGDSWSQEKKRLLQQADEYRRMARKYKRQFGPEEREQRRLLLAEVKKIHEEVRKGQAYLEDKYIREAQVIVSTPIGLAELFRQSYHFDYGIIDEAGQCQEALAWCLIPFATQLILAGDHQQLPPTVLSQEAQQLNWGCSILERAVATGKPACFLNTQYRMPELLIGFSSNWFYDGQLLTAPELKNQNCQMVWLDTAGSGFEEESTDADPSYHNDGEARLVKLLIQEQSLKVHDTVIISPYSSQAEHIRQQLNEPFKCSTVDSFQGQEFPNVIVSMVRSNAQGLIGFLSDYRRMNVAITRSRKALFIIGDSATLCRHRFYEILYQYIEQQGTYRTCWEFEGLF